MALMDKLHTAFDKKNTHFKKLTLKEEQTKGLKTTDQLTYFKIKHYAGIVEYDATEFLEKNSDSLFDSLGDAMRSSSLTALVEMFPKAMNIKTKSPPSSGMKFKKVIKNRK